MVEIRTLTRTLVALAMALTVSLTCSAQQIFVERQLKQLALRSERVEAALASTKEAFAATPTDSLAKVVFELEKQKEAIATAIVTLSTSQEEQERAKEEVNEPPVLTPTEERFKKLFTTSTRRYAMIESEVENIIAEYAEVYKAAAAAIEAHDVAETMKEANAHHKTYTASVERMKALADQIADRSDRLFMSKSAAYVGFADSLDMKEEKEFYIRSEQEVENSMIEKLKGECTDIDVAMYPYRKAVLMNLEVKIARRLCGNKWADSLLQQMATINPEDAKFEPLDGPKRSKAKFADVVIGGKQKYASADNIPRIKVPADGEMYSILLGNYSSLPQMKSFRGVSPLYSERREDGRTYFYAGLYATIQSARTGVDKLRKAGFKQPTIVLWREGIRRNDWVDRTATPTTTTTFYRLEIVGPAEGLSAEVREAIKSKAPNKEISRYTAPTGEVVYTVGIFTKRNQADAVLAAVQAVDSSTNAKIAEIKK
ncbi:MAG: hypothetical protein J6K78_05680 [Tidjanibacter sp.]|nr:hypothetical protein [Tidjanibacter sp.]